MDVILIVMAQLMVTRVSVAVQVDKMLSMQQGEAEFQMVMLGPDIDELYLLRKNVKARQWFLLSIYCLGLNP